MGELSKIPNIGENLEQKLNTIGVYCFEDLRVMGSKAAFTRLHHECGSSCINTLYALEGAIQHTRWHNLDRDTKNHLKEWFSKLD